MTQPALAKLRPRRDRNQSETPQGARCSQVLPGCVTDFTFIHMTPLFCWKSQVVFTIHSLWGGGWPIPSSPYFRKGTGYQTTSFPMLSSLTHPKNACAIFLAHSFNPLKRRWVGLQPIILLQLGIMSQLEMGSEETSLLLERLHGGKNSIKFSLLGTLPWSQSGTAFGRLKNKRHKFRNIGLA